jgi:hypothetical protein
MSELKEELRAMESRWQKVRQHLVDKLNPDTQVRKASLTLVDSFLEEIGDLLTRSDTWEAPREIETDYVLPPGAPSVWVEVDGFSIYIQRTDEGVAVDIYGAGHAMEKESLAGCYAFINDLSEAEEETSETYD